MLMVVMIAGLVRGCDPRRGGGGDSGGDGCGGSGGSLNNKSFVYAPSSSEALWRRADDACLGSCIK